MTAWEMATLGELVSISHGYAFPGTGFVEDPELPVLVTPGNFARGGGFQDAKPKMFRGEIPPDYVLDPGALIVTMTDLSRDGATLGLPAVVPNDGRTYLHNQRIGLVKCLASSRVNKAFLSYRLRIKDYRAHILGTASGSTVRHTSPGRILEFAGWFPPLPEQRAIAEVLGALDDKIAANRRVVDLALDLGDSLVRDAWSAEYLAPLGDTVDIVMGSSPPGTSYNESGEGTVFYQGVRDFGVLSPTPRVWTTEPVRVAAAGDTLIAVRAPVGEVNLATQTTCIGRGLAAAKSDTPSTTFHLLRTAKFAWQPHQGTGTVFASINGKELRALPMPTINTEDGSDLERRLSTIGRRANLALVENERLAATRDALLPLLMSGKVRVKDVEDEVGELV